MKVNIKRILIRALCLILVTVLLLCAVLYGVMLILCKGPSNTARDLFVLSVRETSAVGFLANLCLSEEEILEIENRPAALPVATDTTMVNLESDSGDEWGYTDDDGDGIIIVPVDGPTYSGLMMIVLDPMRVICGCAPDRLGWEGFTLAEFAEMYGAVAGVNGGGFQDEGGKGDGSSPTCATVMNGEIYQRSLGVGIGFVGIDHDGILHVGFEHTQDLVDKNIAQGCGYGPVLVVNGEALSDEELASGVNPRTAIGQRSDGAILMLVINGREISSLGATYMDLADIMLEFGAVNACNLDGGSSTLMYYEGEYINQLASFIGVRDIPTCFLVLEEPWK